MTHRSKLKPFVVTSVSGLPVGQNPSASMELLDTDSGILPNRLTTEQRDAIENPEESLLIYNTDLPGYQYYSNGNWIDFSAGTTIPDDLTVTTLTATSSVSTIDLAATGTISTGDIGCANIGTSYLTVYTFATIQSANINNDLGIGGNAHISSGNYLDFVDSDANWRIGYGLEAFSTELVGSGTNIGIVIGSGPTDGFAIGQTDGQALFELKGSNGRAYFSGSIGIGVANPQFSLDIDGDINATGYRVGGTGFLDADLNAGFASLVVGSSVGLSQGDSTINTGHYYTYGERFPGEAGTPVSGLSGYDGKLMWDADFLYISVGVSDASFNNWKKVALTAL